MPSLAGPKSRAQLASFTRLDDGAFCRVISASLWAPPTPSKQATPGQPAAPKQVVQLALRTVSWHLLCHWPLACLFFCLPRLTEHLFLPWCWTGTHTHTHTWHGHGAIWLAGREIYTRRAILLRSVPPVVERAREESSQASIYAASSSSAHQQTRAAQKAVVFPFRMNHIPSHPSPSQSTRPQPSRQAARKGHHAAGTSSA